jgi:2-haloacid dehalogenase
LIELDLRDFKVLSFDCYGTLIDWETGIAQTLSGWAARHGRKLEREFLLELFGRIESRIEAAFPTTPYREILGKVQSAIAEELNLPTSPSEQEEFGNSVPIWPAFADSSEALKILGARYRLMIISNVDSVSFAGSSKRLGVKFDGVVTAEQVGAYKPDHKMFYAAFDEIESWGVRRSEILHVAQSLFHDHVPAIELGLRTVWVDRRGDETGSGATREAAVAVEPDLTVPNLATLAALAEQSFKG